MTQQKLSKKFIEQCKKITSKRPRTVVQHILQYGFVTTNDLRDKYGYDHPPRAARDVKEQGIPLEMFRVIGSSGRKIAAYRFDVRQKIQKKLLGGRTLLTKKLKKILLERNGAQCAIYLEKCDARQLQIDHRIPFEIIGEPPTTSQSLVPDKYMLLCGSANRAKSWSCEHCENWQKGKVVSVCQTCYWAFPEKHTHVAMQDIRRMDLLWTGKEIKIYEKLKKKTVRSRQRMAAYVKNLIEEHLQK